MKMMQGTADDSGTGRIAQPAGSTASIQPFIHTAHGLAMKLLPRLIFTRFRMCEQPLFTKALQFIELFGRQ